jgi:hypothetical protein
MISGGQFGIPKHCGNQIPDLEPFSRRTPNSANDPCNSSWMSVCPVRSIHLTGSLATRCRRDDLGLRKTGARAADAACRHVQKPSRRRCRPLALQVSGDLRIERDGPAADGLAVEAVACCVKHFLDVAKAEGETETEPDGMTDDLRRELMKHERERPHANASGAQACEWPQTETGWRQTASTPLILSDTRTD